MEYDPGQPNGRDGREAYEVIQPLVATQYGTSACIQVGVVYTRRAEWRNGLVLIINNGRTPMVEHGLYGQQDIRSVLQGAKRKK